jgi:hypothetical protein
LIKAIAESDDEEALQTVEKAGKPEEGKKTVSAEREQAEKPKTTATDQLKSILEEADMDDTLDNLESRPPSSSLLMVDAQVEAQAQVNAQIQATMQARSTATIQAKAASEALAALGVEQKS